LTGLSRSTARVIDLEAHLSQSIADILTTPIGTRVMRREYGSDLPLLIDAPMNGETMIDLFAATAEALDRWEPRFVLRRVQVEEATAGGTLALTLTGDIDGGTVVQEIAL
jgi:uncharacterized protein